MNSLFPALVVLLALAALNAHGNLASKEIFVSPNGKDSWTGSSEHPLRSIQHGCDVASAGDTVTIRSGIYAEQVRLTRSGNYFGRQITIQAAPGEVVQLSSIDTGGQDHLILRGLSTKNSTYLGIAIQGSYRVKLENCKSDSTPGSGVYVDKSHDVVVSNCEVSRACQRGGEESVSIKRSTDVVFEDSIVRDTGHEGIDVKEGSRNVVVRRNRVYHVERQGLYADAWDADTGEIRFENNVIYDCMVGLVACTEAGGFLHDVSFVGNVVYDCRGPGMMVAKWGSPRMTHRIENVAYLNNTVVNCGGPGRNGPWAGGMLLENDQAAGVTVVNNLFSGNPFAQLRVTLGLPPKDIVAHHNIIDGPGENITQENFVTHVTFVDPTKKDFRLAPGFKGALFGAVDSRLGDTDAAGKRRFHDGIVDIGAFSSAR